MAVPGNGEGGGGEKGRGGGGVLPMACPPVDRPPSDRSSHKMTLKKPQRARWVDHGRELRPQVHESTPERRKNKKCGGREEKREFGGPLPPWAHPVTTLGEHFL